MQREEQRGHARGNHGEQKRPEKALAGHAAMPVSEEIPGAANRPFRSIRATRILLFGNKLALLYSFRLPAGKRTFCGPTDDWLVASYILRHSHFPGARGRHTRLRDRPLRAYR